MSERSSQRVVRPLPSAASEVESSDQAEEGLAGAGRRLRMRKVTETIETEEQKEDRMLKELGLFEKGMSREQKQELLMVVAASEKSANMEEKSRQISVNLDRNDDIDPKSFIFDQISEEQSNSKLLVDVEDSPRSPSPCLFNDSCHSSPKVVPESQDIFDSIFQKVERKREKERAKESNTTLNNAEPMNEDASSTDTLCDDDMKRKFDHKQLDSLDIIEDDQPEMLISKRKAVSRTRENSVNYSKKTCLKNSKKTLNKSEPLNEDVSPTEVLIDDDVRRKYDRKQIDPLDYIEDVQPVKLINKRKYGTGGECGWNCCCPNGTLPKDFARSLRKNFEMYHSDLYILQRHSLNYLEWGAPVVVGRCCSDTLDVWNPRHCARLRGNLEDTNKEDNDIIRSGSEGEFESLHKEDNLTKRKFNFKSKCRTFGGDLREKPKELRSSVYNFMGSSDEDDPFKKCNRASMLNENVCEEEIKSSSEEFDENKNEEWVPRRKPVKEKSRPLRLGLGKTRASSRAPSVLGRKSFYGKSASQAFDIHRVNEEMRPQSAVLKPTVNLQDVLKPNLKINVNKVGLGKKWLPKDGGREQLLGSSDKVNSSGDDVEIVDTLSKRVARNRGDDEEVGEKVCAPRKLAGLVRSVKSDDEGSSMATGESLSKRLRLDNVLDRGNDKPVKLNITKSVPSTSGQFFHPNGPDPVLQGEQPDIVDVPCPLCAKKFAQSAIEEHASDCLGGEEEPSWIQTRTPKNKYRCYICGGVFEPDAYNDHVVVCVARKRTTRVDVSEELLTPEVKIAEMQKSNNYSHSTPSCLDTPKFATAASTKIFSFTSDESPLVNNRLLRSASVRFNDIDDCGIPLEHVSTPTFQMFKPISQLKDSVVDFKNQFPVARQGKRRKVAKLVKTKKRRRSFKGKKSPRGRKSK